MKPGLRRFFSIAIWTLAASGALFLWSRSKESSQAFRGIVQPKSYRISAPITTTVKAIHVRRGDPVKAGQAILNLDTGDLDDQLVVARAQLDEMLARLEAQSDEAKTRIIQQRLELSGRLANARVQYSAATTKRAGDSAEIKTLSKRLARLAEVEQAGLAELDRLSQIHARRDRLATTNRSAAVPARVYGSYIDELSEALDALQIESIARQLKPYRLKLLTQKARIAALERQRRLRTLRAPVDGQVVRIDGSPGDIVKPGLPVVQLVASRSESLVAYMPEHAARRVALGSTVRVQSIDGGQSIGAQGTVTQLGQQIIELPTRLWPRPSVPTFGRPVHIQVAAGHNLLPGELVMVKQAAHDARAAIAPRDAGVRVSIPRDLETKTRLEISGALWMPERGTYLIVSDDTGRKKHNSGVPWLFEVDPDGQVRPQPILISGVDAISDLEAITRGPNGQIYLISSQSMSKKGQRPARRQLLIRGHLSGQTFEVSGHVHLYQYLLETLDDNQRRELGVSHELDIEGLTWSGKSLLLGLKAPFHQANKARIWAIDNPDILFAEPESRGTAIKIRHFAKLYLPTGIAERPGGISDLMVRGDKLYVLSTVPSGTPAGAAWRVDLRNPKNPIRLSQWEMLKPEAIAQHRSDQLTIFFDRGAEHPMMTAIAP